MIYYNGIIHGMVYNEDILYAIEVEKGMIVRVFRYQAEVPDRARKHKAVNLDGMHVYPCRIDPEAKEDCPKIEGTLQAGKKADFFLSVTDMSALTKEAAENFRPVRVYCGGKPVEKNG